MESSRITADENGPHQHVTRIYTNNNTAYKMATDGIRLNNANDLWMYAGDSTAGSVGGDICGITDTAGGGKPHENRQPYQTVYIFRRTL